jgi:hypothetical protein
LQIVLERVKELPVEDLPRLLGDLEVIRVTAMARLTAPAPVPQRDELVNVARAAQRLGVSEDYLYRHAGQFAFVRRMGRKLTFSSLGIDDYIKRRAR